MQKDEIINLISSLSEHNFKDLVKSFNKEYYHTSDVRIVDGPYDGGNDLEIFIDGQEVRRNIQITVQKTAFDAKLYEDLRKASENISQYSYQNKLDFYISKVISKDKKNELKRAAELNYQIDLKIFDANTFAELSDEHTSILASLTEVYSAILTEPIINIDKKQKITYDFIANSHQSGSIKKQFIYSYILSYLFDNQDSSAEDIHNGLRDVFSGNFDLQFFISQLNVLKGKGQVITPQDKRHYRLSDESFNSLQKIYAETNALEGLLKNSIDEFFEKNNISKRSEELIPILFEAYKENYKVDIDELTSRTSSFQSSIKKVYGEVVKFFEQSNFSNNEARQLTRGLLDICSNNDYLNKLGVSILFTNLFKSNKLEKYISKNPQDLYLDTQILLRILCIKYLSPELESADIAIKSVKEFVQTTADTNSNVSLLTFSDYVDEVVGHLLEALKLQRFLRLPYISKFGPSKNVFYNFYLELIDKGVLNNISFESFIGYMISDNLPSYTHPSFLDAARRKFRDIFDLYEISVIDHPTYSNYNEVKKEYEYELMNLGKDRSYSARENDLRTILYLSTPEFHVDSELGILAEPYLITWDSAFYSFRRRLMTRFSNFSYWYIYSPLKYADKLSVTNFKINSKAINFNIIALAESNFNYTAKTTSFFDLMSSLFNRQDVGEGNLVHKLVNLKEKTQSNDTHDEEMNFKEPKSPVTEMLITLRDYYYGPNTKFKFADFVTLLENSAWENKILSSLERNIDLFSRKAQSPAQLFSEFDALIEQSLAQDIG